MTARARLLEGPRPGASATVTRLLSTSAAAALFVLLPGLMTIANKSAPFSLGLAAALANAAVLSCYPLTTLAGRYAAALRTGTALLFCSLAVLITASFLWTIDPGATRRSVVEALPEFLFALALAAAAPLVIRPRHFQLLKVGLIVASALIVLEFAAGMPIHRLVGARAADYDLKRSAVPLALLLWPAVDYCVARGERAWAVGLGAASLVAAVVSHSSASVVAVAGSAMVYVAARFAPRSMLAISVILAFALLAMAPWTGTLTSRLLSEKGAALLSRQHADIRIGLWTNFEHHIAERLAVGHGFGTSSKIATDPSLDHSADVDMVWNVHPHNAMLQIWVELGLLGVAWMTCAIIFCGRRIAQLSAPERASRLAFLAGAAAVTLVGLNAWGPWWLAVASHSLVSFLVLRDGPPQSSNEGRPRCAEAP